MKYDYKITFGLNQPFDIAQIKSVCNQYPNSKILVEVQNTKGISSSMIQELSSNVAIRIAGGYDADRISRCEKGELRRSSNYYYEAVIYTVNETLAIIKEIERIESGLSKKWSDIQKLLYIYDRLKTDIMYDPKFERKSSSDIRSLRGLISKTTVCAGYALILKEFMDRNGISCEYVEGVTDNKNSGHAWNIVNIGGKKYPIDLTWDNAIFRSGKANRFDWLGMDIPTFSRCHYPAKGEKTQDYEHTLSQIDSRLLKRIYPQMGIDRARDYRSTTYLVTRKDGSKFIVAQIGDATINNNDYYRYYYADIPKEGEKLYPLILYGDVNITHLIDCKEFGEDIPQNYEKTVINILFSIKNIEDSLSKKTYYIGGIKQNEDDNKLELVSSYQEISKPEDKRNLFVYPSKRFTRSDGSVFIVQKMSKNSFKVDDIDVMRYDIFEMVNENGQKVLKRNTVFTERDFFEDKRQSMIDDYLSRERLDRKVGEAGGYIGYYDANGRRTYNSDLVKYFETSSEVDIDSLSMQKQIPVIQIPTFAELKSLASKYEIFIDSQDPYESDTSKIKIRDIKTGQIQTDKSIIYRAMFANIWLTSAGVKYCQNESRPGAKYAFNEGAEELYNTICKKLLNACKVKGVIDTVDLFRNIENNNYKYNQEIIVNLFKNPYQTKMINKLFLQSLGIDQQPQTPEPLYKMSYAYKLAFRGNTQEDDGGR